MLGLDVLEKATRTGTSRESSAFAERVQRARVSVVVGGKGASTLISRVKKRIENARFVARMGITRGGNPDMAGVPRAKSSSTETT